MAPKTGPRLKKSSKSGFFSQPKTMLENRAQTIGKTQKMNSNKSSKSEQSYNIQSRPQRDLSEASARPQRDLSQTSARPQPDLRQTSARLQPDLDQTSDLSQT